VTHDAHEVAAVIRKIARGRASLTSNDVWDVIGTDAELDHPNGTMGSAFSIARRRGWIAPTQETTVSNHPARKHGLIRVWRSRYYI
jgi:hypothetical protein